jgi:hypothetical protein
MKQITIDGVTYKLTPVQEAENTVKDWEIIEFEGKHWTWKLRDDGTYSSNRTLLNTPGISFERVYDVLKDKIQSVRRLSDGEIFSLGDAINYNDLKGYWGGNKFNGKACEIQKFYIEDNEILINSHPLINEEGGYNSIDKWIKYVEPKKEPLFVTKDGVQIFDMEYILFGVTNSYLISTVALDRLLLYKLENKIPYFSTREKAEEYVVMNKPCLSIKEVLHFEDNPQLAGNLEYILKKIVKSRI